MRNGREIRIPVNAKYRGLYEEKARYKDLWGGRGRGGSHTGTDYFIYLITRPSYFRGYLLRYTSSDIRLSLYRGLKDRIRQNETLHEDDFAFNENQMSVCYIPTGNMIFSKGVAKDSGRTAAMKSLEGATHVLIEEADEIPELEFDQMDLSLRTMESAEIEIIRIFNPPPKRHWIWRDYILEDFTIPIHGVGQTFFTARPKIGSGILSIFGTYYDNIQNIHPTTITKFETFKQTNPEYYWTVIRGYITDGARGRIYSGWKFITSEIFESLQLPHVYAIDFGYSIDPNALIKIKYEDTKRYCRELIYSPNMDNVQLAKRMRDVGVSSSDLVIADMGNGGDLRIAELRRGFQHIEGYPDLRFNIHPTFKGQGSINFGINKVKECDNYITEDSYNFSEEYIEYRWALDVNKNPTDRPIDTKNHCMDARRYAELTKGRMW
jgi:phage terminase large subunit